ncbi:class I SAM-dependent methyltransferase [Sulfitobacter sp. F26204]|uniref:class I SAM-dependent methyltransferase n=1 Tax=Sulfitobacter sp. F26204 TaxID=2996014 RepID=UPI00225E4671|nr:class I SAM-dependent methyltransferase [Sulfitobacter sp. F26204]MCX7559526.1 class I SAM-dependent methyltransferase [Sulfitobacter sp. F26204]
MTSDPTQAFFTLHRDLPREGPGEPADIHWAASVAGTPQTAQMADVGCGPGGDIGSLLEIAPRGQVTALDKIAHFVTAARETWQGDGRVTVLKADMAVIRNQYDLIWCAGAVYFLGVTEALTGWRKSLTRNGVIAFSEICWFTDRPSPRARKLWSGYPAMTDAAGIQQRVEAAGYEVLDTRPLSDAAWEAYLTPLEIRIAALRKGADSALQKVLDEAAEEAACWREHRQEFGYLLSVVRPK